jgi:high-affinity iron transporter
VGIFAAYLIKTDRRAGLKYLWGGVIAAVVLSIAAGTVLALTATTLSSEVEEALAGSLSLVAVGLVTWMILWLARTARSLAGHLRSDVDRVYARGAGWGMFFLAFFAVGREGLETALFIWAAAGTAGQGALPLVGAVLGLAIAVTLGYLIYAGMSRLNIRSFFAWSGALLVVMVAGVLSYGIHEFQEVGWLPGAEDHAFNVSAAIPPDSWYGTLLRGTIGFTPNMTWLQVGGWVAYVAVVMPVFLSISLRRGKPQGEAGDETSAARTPEVAATVRY